MALHRVHSARSARAHGRTGCLVALAQSAEHWIVAPEVTGSIPVGHPNSPDHGPCRLVTIAAPARSELEAAVSKVIALMSMSLDGFVADPDDNPSAVFDWYFNSGEVAVPVGGADPMTFHVSEPSARHLHELTSGLGAMLTGRRTFEVADGWGGTHAWGPAFVVTHEVPAGWPRPGSTVHFVTDGIESAVRQAKAAAGGRNVAVHGADTIQQCLNAGLLDELQVDVAAVLLGSGIRLFDHLSAPVVLGSPTVVAGTGVTHLNYPVHRG